jgi:hypothetical protein
MEMVATLEIYTPIDDEFAQQTLFQNKNKKKEFSEATFLLFHFFLVTTCRLIFLPL